MTRSLVPILLAGYLLGSIPFSYLVARLFGVVDVRQVGSGNVGATNVMRSAGKAAGLLALALDFTKGVAASIVADRLAPTSDLLPAVAAVAAILGHMHPVWLSFRGGKGVATGVGAFLPLAPLAAIGGVAAFVASAWATRYVSVGSCVGAGVLASLAFVTGPSSVAWCAAAAAALIVWKHRANLRRVAAGVENRLGRGKGTT
jgi:glycerol-3-phosphate acyltransferase PlsY